MTTVWATAVSVLVTVTLTGYVDAQQKADLNPTVKAALASRAAKAAAEVLRPRRNGAQERQPQTSGQSTYKFHETQENPARCFLSSGLSKCHNPAA